MVSLVPHITSHPENPLHEYFNRVLRTPEALFGQGSPTFRRGQIGSWKENFTAEHKTALKRVAGQELVAPGCERDLDW